MNKKALEQMQPAIESLVEAHGASLYDLILSVNAGDQVLRVFVDHPEGVTLDLCAEISTALGNFLDEQDPFEEAYQLEVSSPGVFRSLRTQEHFEQAVGQRIQVKAHAQQAWGKVVHGALQAVSPEGLLLLVEGNDNPILIGYPQVAKATLFPEITF
jgi:ribosome maturation factor RimP